MADRKAELERKKERLRQMREEKERRKREKEKADAEATALTLKTAAAAAPARSPTTAHKATGPLPPRYDMIPVGKLPTGVVHMLKLYVAVPR